MTTKQPPRMAAHSSLRICIVRTGPYQIEEAADEDRGGQRRQRVKAVQMAGRGRPRGHQAWVPGTPAAEPREPTA